MRCVRTLFLAGSLLTAPFAYAAPLPVVRVEAAWCNIAAQIGGPAVQTQSLISTPGIDPHELTPTPSMARNMAHASVIVLNGATYDDWAVHFSPSSATQIIAAEEAGWRAGDNPHLFLDLNAVRKVASAVADAFIARGLDQTDIHSRLTSFLTQVDALSGQTAAIRQKHDGTIIGVMEPVGADLIQTMGLRIIDPGFALSVMHHSEPSPRDVAQLETAIDSRQIRFLIVNPAVRSPQIDRMVERARGSGLPLVMIGETLPVSQQWQDWVSSILQSVQQALDGQSR